MATPIQKVQKSSPFTKVNWNDFKDIFAKEGTPDVIYRTIRSGIVFEISPAGSSDKIITIDLRKFVDRNLVRGVKRAVDKALTEDTREFLANEGFNATEAIVARVFAFFSRNELEVALARDSSGEFLAEQLGASFAEDKDAADWVKKFTTGTQAGQTFVRLLASPDFEDADLVALLKLAREKTPGN